MVVSISGLDNAGKTTQCNLLRTKYPEVFDGPFHIKDMPSFDKDRCDTEWWFSPNNITDFTTTIYSCLAERISIARDIKDKVVIFDKGADFYDTRVIATLVSKGLTVREAQRRMLEVRRKYIVDNYEDLKLFLTSRPENNNIFDGDVRYKSFIGINKILLGDVSKRFIVIPVGSIEATTQRIKSNIVGCLVSRGEGDEDICKRLQKH